jgi:PadR family transcriptional regulator, regulatory protein PadR
MVLKTLDALGPLHGFGIARRVEQVGGEQLTLNQGTLYPVLLRLEQEGGDRIGVAAFREQSASAFLPADAAERKQLQAELASLYQTADIIARFLAINAEKAL